MAEYDAPALRRGLEVMAILQEGGALSLEDLARQTGYPKSSLLRLLEVLAEEGVVAREQKQYQLLMRLAPVSDDAFEDRVRWTLRRLAEETGQTAEWYLPDEAGMRIVERYESPSAEAGVRARIGFIRGWEGELDAVLACGVAFFSGRGGDDLADGPERLLPVYQAYLVPGVLSSLSAGAAKTKIAKARQDGCCVDHIVNPNHVRRLAAVVGRSGRPYGVIALAELVGSADLPTECGLTADFLRLIAPLLRSFPATIAGDVADYKANS